MVVFALATVLTYLPLLGLAFDLAVFDPLNVFRPLVRDLFDDLGALLNSLFGLFVLFVLLSPLWLFSSILRESIEALRQNLPEALMAHLRKILASMLLVFE
jgi:hypothetical protein